MILPESMFPPSSILIPQVMHRLKEIVEPLVGRVGLQEKQPLVELVIAHIVQLFAVTPKSHIVGLSFGFDVGQVEIEGIWQIRNDVMDVVDMSRLPLIILHGVVVFRLIIRHGVVEIRLKLIICHWVVKSWLLLIIHHLVAVRIGSVRKRLMPSIRNG